MRPALPIVAAALVLGPSTRGVAAQDPLRTRVTLVSPVLIGEPARNAAAGWLPEGDRATFLATSMSIGWRVAGIRPGSAVAWSLELPPAWVDEGLEWLDAWVGRVCLGVGQSCLELGSFDLRSAIEGFVVRVPEDAPAAGLELRVVVGADRSPRVAMTRAEVARVALRVAVVS